MAFSSGDGVVTVTMDRPNPGTDDRLGREMPAEKVQRIVNGNPAGTRHIGMLAQRVRAGQNAAAPADRGADGPAATMPLS